jgi:hypothetical protein
MVFFVLAYYDYTKKTGDKFLVSNILCFKKLFSKRKTKATLEAEIWRTEV